MTPREAIDRAKIRLAESRELSNILNQRGYVRVPVVRPLSAVIGTHESEAFAPSPDVVTFTIEDGFLGKRLIADFDGCKEYAA